MRSSHFRVDHVETPMRSSRSLLLFSTTFVVFGCMAQDAVRITDLAQMVRKPDLAEDRSVRSGMQAAGLDNDRIELALHNGKASQLPIGLSTDSALAINAELAQNYRAHRICSYSDGTGSQVLVQVLMEENHHMPNELRSKQDLYLVFPEEAVEMNLTDARRPKASPGPNWERMKPAKILVPDGVYATYDLAGDPLIMQEMMNAGLNTAEIDAVVFRCHERNWPSGIDEFNERYPRLKEFKKYKAFEVAHWDDKVLLAIPSAVNKRMPVGTRPAVDIYMVYTKNSVEVSKKAKKQKKVKRRKPRRR